MPNPILVELTRAALVESVHRGALAIARPNGEMVVSLGDVKRPVFPRSAVKAFQCLPLVESGAADAFGFGDREISIACASHSGTPAHAELAASMLARAHLTERALGCGAHEPMLGIVRAGVGGGRTEAVAAAQQLLGQARRHVRLRRPPQGGPGRLLAARSPGAAAHRESAARVHRRGARR